MNLKGTLPVLILAILGREVPAHGYEIAKIIKEESGCILDFGDGTLYPTLKKMEEDGLIESLIQNVDGRERKVFQITILGLSKLSVERKDLLQKFEGIRGILKS